MERTLKKYVNRGQKSETKLYQMTGLVKHDLNYVNEVRSQTSTVDYMGRKVWAVLMYTRVFMAPGIFSVRVLQRMR